MIYDCFTFFNELDLLEIRLNVLNDYVDKFVIVEATRTQNNKEKPLFFEQNKERFSKFKDKFIHIVVDKFPEKINVWTIENYQRSQIAKGLTDCNDDDIILISDLDEIPNPEYIKKFYKDDKIVAFDMNVFTYKLNNYTVGYDWTHGTKMLSYKNFKSILNDEDFSKTYALEYPFNIGTNPNTIRLYYGEKQIHLKNAGWHFSYIGNIDTVLKKHHSTSDGQTNLREEECKKLINSNKFLDTYYLVPVYIDDSFPKYIQDNQTKYKNLIINENCKNIHSKLLNIMYKFRYFCDNIFVIKEETKRLTTRIIVIIFGIKISVKRNKDK